MMLSAIFGQTSALRRGLIYLVSAALVFQPVFAWGREGIHPRSEESSDASLSGGAGEGSGQPLQIDILDGEGALNNIRERTAREPIVQVTDKNHKPVAGALVVFAIQPGKSGGGLFHHAASASFHGTKVLRVRTDANGRAVAHGLTPNKQSGSYSIQVTATAGGEMATVTIHELNVVGTGSSASTPHSFLGPHTSLFTWTAVGVAAAGAAAAVTVVLVNGKNSSTITAGTGTVGKP